MNPIIPSTTRVKFQLTTAASAGLLAAALLSGCGRDDTRKLKTETIASENTPAPQSQLDMTPAAPAQPAATNVVETPTPPQIVTNAPPPLVIDATNAPPPATVKAFKEYTVAKGDTLLKIARANGIRFTALSNANKNLNLSKLTVGQKLRIPTGSTASANTIGLREPANGPDMASGNIHVVKAGETLTRIARENHTSVKALQTANNLKTARVLVGQRLRLPTPAQPAAPATATSNPPTQIQASATPPK